jgi:hypothetical protein
MKANRALTAPELAVPVQRLPSTRMEREPPPNANKREIPYAGKTIADDSSQCVCYVCVCDEMSGQVLPQACMTDKRITIPNPASSRA